jgi:glutaredoxin-related protein
MLPSNKCPKCAKFKRDVFRFKIKFDREIINESMAEALPEDGNTSGIFCIL